MTWGNPPAFVPTKPKKAPKLIMPEDLAASGSEDGHQSALFCWCSMNVGKYPPLKYFHSIPNGGSRHIAEATKMVAAGLRKGVLDTFLPYASKMAHIQEFSDGHYNGCYIEMKEASKRGHKNGGMTDQQVEFMLYCGAAGYFAKVCYSWTEARDTLIDYLEGKL